MTTKERVNEIYKLREELLVELKNLQNNCSHEYYTIGTYSWREGSFNQMRVCEECSKCFESPSKEEQEEFNTEMKMKENIKSTRNHFSILPVVYIGQGTKVYKR